MGIILKHNFLLLHIFIIFAYMKKIPTYNQMYKMAPAEIQKLLDKCADIPQSEKWHPEGHVLKHTKIVYERARATGNLDLSIAAIFHDLGKISTTKKNKHGSWAAHGHEFVSKRIVEEHEKWIESIGGDPDVIKDIVWNHMKIKQINNMRPHKKQALKELSVYPLLQKFTKCDDMSALTEEEMRL